MKEVLDVEKDYSGHDEFRQFLESQFGITDPVRQNLIIGLFNFAVLKHACSQGFLPWWDPMEAARQELIACGVTNPEQQRPVLQRFYLELDDPRWSQP